MKIIEMPENMKVIEMDTNEGEKQFKPITNHLDSNASWQNDEGDGIMFETYGEELEYVRNKHKENPNCIWTLMDSDDGEDTIVVEGYHFVNRIGYFITENQYQERVNYIIK